MLPTVDEFLALDKLAFAERVEAGQGESLSDEQQRERFEATLPLSQVCTVRRQGTLVAYAMLQPQTDTRWFVTCFNTHPQHRSAPVLYELYAGFGALVQRFGITELRSNVYKDNALSLSFHRRLGFVQTRENELAVELTATVSEMFASPAMARTARRMQKG